MRHIIWRGFLRVRQDEIPHYHAMLKTVGCKELLLLGLELRPQPDALERTLQDDTRRLDVGGEASDIDSAAWVAT